MVSASRSNMKTSSMSASAAFADPVRSSALARGVASLGLGLEPCVGLADVDDEARVGAAADRLQLVLGSDFERHLAALDRHHLGGDLDGHAEQSRSKMAQRNVH